MPFLSFLSNKERCEDCEKKLRNELNELKTKLVTSKEITPQQLNFLKLQKKDFLIKYYQEIIQDLTEDKELSIDELEFLKSLQNGLELTKEEVKFDDLILPYIYVLSIKQENVLPTYSFIACDDGTKPILKKDEKLHFGATSVVKEIRATSRSFEGGSHGVSFRIMKGVSYRVGAFSGQSKPVQSLVETSRGALVITNKRVLLHPAADNKPMSIPINKIASYRCYKDGVEIYKEGREKGFFFTLSQGQSECAGICLNYLIERLE